jgi:PAS domain S-box-containing protein
MTWQVNTIGLIFWAASLLNGAILIYSLRHREVRGAFAFSLMMASMTAWALFLALEYSVVEIENKILFSKFQYFGIATIGLTWFLFAYGYNQSRKLPGQNYLWLTAIPILVIILAFTNEYHRLLWPEIRPVSAVPGADLIYDHGPVFWANLVYNYILLSIGTVILIRAALSSKNIYRWQMIGLVTSAIIPWVGNAVSVAGLSPIPGLDLAPIALVISGAIIAWSIFYLRLLDLLPVAYDQVVVNLTDGVIILDELHRIADANQAARQMLRVERERIIGRNILEVLQPWPRLAESLRHFDLGQIEIAVEDDRISDIDIRISALLDQKGTRVGRIAIFRDISETKKIERMRSELAQSIVNDLRNPLTSMSLSLEMLRRQANALLPKTQIETLDSSQTNLQQMLEQVDAILDIYRLQSGEIPLERRPTLLESLAEEAARPLNALAHKKRILLQLDVPDLAPVQIDPILMRRVLQTLLSNSIKHSQDGRIVRLTAGYNRNAEVVISVIDSAIGLELPLEGDLFEAPAKQQTASSLGLAFCRLAIEAHGGNIWQDKNYENGTKISFSLPDIRQSNQIGL